jgi:hypothetical protein
MRDNNARIELRKKECENIHWIKLRMGPMMGLCINYLLDQLVLINFPLHHRDIPVLSIILNNVWIFAVMWHFGLQHLVV